MTVCGLVSTTDVLVGGTTPTARNIISGNGGSSGFGSGIHFFNFRDSRTRFKATSSASVPTEAARQHGVRHLLLRPAECRRRNVIGGIAEGAGNVIAYNGAQGINVGANLTATPGRLRRSWATRSTPMGFSGSTFRTDERPDAERPVAALSLSARTRLRHRAERPPELPSHRERSAAAAARRSRRLVSTAHRIRRFGSSSSATPSCNEPSASLLVVLRRGSDPGRRAKT